jgi:FAD/FMN-containing dehydrogenase
MRDVEVDTDRRVVRVGGGATWADVDPVTVAAGFATTGGRVSTTGVAGLTMGGGSGWLERKHGLACDNLVAAELVLADGEIVRTTESERPELLWALRGGGGNFGVVTALELRVHPIPELILGGMLMWPRDRGLEVLERFRDVMDGAPDGLSLAAMYFTCPDEDGFPADLRGEAVLAVLGGHAGPVAEAESLFAPLRELGPAADMVEPMPYDVLNRSFDDPPGFRNYWTAEQLPEPPDDAALAAIHGLATRLPHPAAQLFIVVWGGQVARAQPGSSPLAARDTAWTVHPLILWDDPADDAAMVAYARGYREALAPWSSGEVYLNFVGEEGAERTAAGYAAEARERIAAIKAAYDPDEVFRTHQTL